MHRKALTGRLCSLRPRIKSWPRSCHRLRSRPSATTPLDALSERVRFATSLWVVCLCSSRQGSFGKVRLAVHKLTSQRCAIKQIPRSVAPPLLTREIHHHRRLHHANVLQLYEVIATESNIWLITELCAGGELFDYLVEKGRLGEHEVRRMFGQLCLGVGYIHGQGVVHRDLKLENVLLDERCNVKIADFGFGREFEQRRLMETFCGTTGYAAPEMLAGKKYTGEGESSI